MLVSGQMITYNRVELVEEAVESFLRQDYKGDKELIILNDCPEQTLVFNHPEVHIINVNRRFDSVGAKRNACVSLCKGEIIFPWDDDDISLPYRISVSLKYKGTGKYFKNKRAWIWSNGKIDPNPKYNVYHAMGCWDKKYYMEADGYPMIQSGQDIGIEKRFMKLGGRNVKEIPKEEVYYIYRFGGTGRIHISSCGWDKGWKEVGKTPIERTGIIELKPNWKERYDVRIKEICKYGEMPTM
jgi:glycosyltransferase involved in cell wall biosynthesis